MEIVEQTKGMKKVLPGDGDLREKLNGAQVGYDKGLQNGDERLVDIYSGQIYSILAYHRP